MRVKNHNLATRRLYNEEVMDEPIEFASTGTVQVDADLGEALVAHYDAIEPYEGSDTK